MRIDRSAPPSEDDDGAREMLDMEAVVMVEVAGGPTLLPLPLPPPSLPLETLENAPPKEEDEEEDSLLRFFLSRPLRLFLSLTQIE